MRRTARSAQQRTPCRGSMGRTLVARRAPSVVSAIALILHAALSTGCKCREASKPRGADQPPVVVVDPDEIGRPPAIPEREPNEVRTAAQDIPIARQIEGTMQHRGDARRGDVDWYRVVVNKKEQVLTARLTGARELDLILEAYSAQGKRLMRVNNTKVGGGEVLVNLRAEPATYFLRVRERKARSGPGRYRIGYELRQAEQGEEREPNWKASLATPLTMDEEAVGYLGWHTDNDWYRVELQKRVPGARFRIELDGVDNVRASLAVWDPGGKVLQERLGATGEGVILSNLVFDPGSPHVHVVVKCRRQYNVETRYSLRVLSNVPPGPTEVEPNDRPQQGTALKPDTPAVAGLLGDSRDRDVYRVTTPRPGFFKVAVVPPLGLDVALAVLDAEGKESWKVDQGKARQEESIPVLWVGHAGALVMVRAPHRRRVNLVSPYHIKVATVTGVDWEREPNDEGRLATIWAEGRPLVMGHIHPAQDVDYFELTDAGDQRNLSVSVPDKMKLKLELIDPAGNAVASAVSTGPGQVIELKAPVSTGSARLLKVSGVDGSTSSGKEYRIQQVMP